MTNLMNLLRAVSALPMFAASAALFALMGLTFFDVVLRSMFNAPIEAATELTRIAIAIVVFSALPVVSARDDQIAVDLLDTPFRRLRLERLRDGIVALFCGAILILPALRVTVLAERARSYGDQTEYLAIPTYFIAWFIAVMTFLTAFTLLVRGLLHLFMPRALEPFHD